MLTLPDEIPRACAVKTYSLRYDLPDFKDDPPFLASLVPNFPTFHLGSDGEPTLDHPLTFAVF